MNYITIQKKSFKIQNYGSLAFLLIPDQAIDFSLGKIAEAILSLKEESIEEVIASDHDVCIITTNGKLPISSLQQLKLSVDNIDQKIYTIPICFELAADLEIFCQSKSLTIEAFKSELCGTSFELSMYGFLAGFLYLNGLPEHLHQVRKSTPKLNVPAGSIGIGGKYIGMYGIESPGGWNVIARTPLNTLPIDIVQNPLKIQTKIKFEAISLNSFEVIKKQELTLKDYNEL